MLSCYGLSASEEQLMKGRKPKRVALYLRVSTSEQTTRNQRRELRAVAERHGRSGDVRGFRHLWQCSPSDPWCPRDPPPPLFWILKICLWPLPQMPRFF